MAELVSTIANEIPYGPGLWKSLRDAPINFYRRWNTILDFFEFRCHGHWRIYLETMFPALGEAVIALLGFDWDDIARAYFRPSGLRSRHKMRGGSKESKKKSKRRKFLNKLELPEFGEIIGKNLPGAKIVKARSVSNVGRYLWILDAYAQRALYWYMIADVSTDFLYNWTTGLYRSKECYRGAAGYAIYGPTGIGFPGDGEWHRFLPVLRERGGNIRTGLPIQAPSGSSGVFVTVHWPGEYFASGPGTPSISVGIMDADTGDFLDGITDIRPDQVAERSATAVQRVPPGRRVYPVVRATGSYTVVVRDVEVMVATYE